MLNVKGNFPGSSDNTFCTYCNAGPETQQHIMKDCTRFDDLTGEANLNQLDENQNLDFKKEAHWRIEGGAKGAIFYSRLFQNTYQNPQL